MNATGGESADELRGRLLHLLDGFDDEAPFTLQRLAEVLLEPQKQYARLDKLVSLCFFYIVSITMPLTAQRPTSSWTATDRVYLKLGLSAAARGQLSSSSVTVCIGNTLRFCS